MFIFKITFKANDLIISIKIKTYRKASEKTKKHADDYNKFC